MERQKKREQEVLEKIQKIWTEIAEVKREICEDSCVSISSSLGLSLKNEGSPFFLAHQEIQQK